QSIDKVSLDQPLFSARSIRMPGRSLPAFALDSPRSRFNMNVKVELCSRRNPSARISRALVVLFFIVFLGGQQSAQAQYMFLDVNGDSLNTQEDFWQFIGPTDTATVDVYLVTNGDRFGGAHACSPETPGLNSYTV